jgi:hypothetical protein
VYKKMAFFYVIWLRLGRVKAAKRIKERERLSIGCCNIRILLFARKNEYFKLST